MNTALAIISAGLSVLVVCVSLYAVDRNRTARRMRADIRSHRAGRQQ